MKKFLWIILAIIMFPIAPIPVIIGLVAYSYIKKQQKQGNPYFQSLQENFEKYGNANWQKSFSSSWTWPPKPEPYSPTPTPIHIHRQNLKHRHKSSGTSDQELHLRLAIIAIGLLVVGLLLASSQNLLN